MILDGISSPVIHFGRVMVILDVWRSPPVVSLFSASTSTFVSGRL